MLAPEGTPLTVRWYTPDDLAQMVKIHAVCLPLENWTEGDLLAFVQRKSPERVNVLKVLAEKNGPRILGTLLYAITPDCCQLRRVCIAPELRRRGYGSYMVRSLIGPQSPIRKELFTARVSERYADAAYFFHDSDLGFVKDDTPAYDAAGEAYYWFTYRKPVRARRILVGL